MGELPSPPSSPPANGDPDATVRKSPRQNKVKVYVIG